MYENTSVFPCPVSMLLPPAGAPGTRQPALATGSRTLNGCKNSSTRNCSLPGLFRGPEELELLILTQPDLAAVEPIGS